LSQKATNQQNQTKQNQNEKKTHTYMAQTHKFNMWDLGAEKVL
jgi:hypothetical protein